ncbi:MAG: hypothetical protein ACKV22_00520 [Bryobacteraceae bacterium]
MQELIVSMMRLSAAMTLFGMQQIQNAVGAAADTHHTLEKFRKALDSMTDAMAKEMDESKTAALDSMTKVQTDIINRTWDAMNVESFDPREMMSTMADLTKKTSDSLADLVVKSESKSDSEPKAAANAVKDVVAAAAKN